jgi:hypothetical protein
MNGTGAAQQDAQTRFVQAVTDAMTPQEQAALNTSYRQVVVAQRNVDGQQLVANVQAAQQRTLPGYARAPDDAAAFRAQQKADVAQAKTQLATWVAQGYVLKATWARDDAHAIVYTDSVTQQLNTAQQAVTTARQQALVDTQGLHNSFARRSLVEDATQAAEDNYQSVSDKLLNPQDLKTLTALDDNVQAWSAAGSQVIDESGAAADLTKAQLDQLTNPGSASTSELTQAQKYVAYVQANQHTRDVTLQLAGTQKNSDQYNKVMGELVNSQVASQQALTDYATYMVDTKQSQYNAADAAYKRKAQLQSGGIRLASYEIGSPSQAAGAVPDASLSQLAQARATASSDLAQARSVLQGSQAQLQQLQKVQQSLQPKHLSWWQHALSVVGSVAELAGGVIALVTTSWTGFGAVVGAAGIIAGVHGLFNTAHSISDWVNGTNTDAPLASLCEHQFHMSQSWANGIDTGVSMASFVADGAGAAKMFQEATTKLGTIGAVANATVTVDNFAGSVQYMAGSSNPVTLGSLAAKMFGGSATDGSYIDMALGVGGGVLGGGGNMRSAGRADAVGAMKGNTPTTPIGKAIGYVRTKGIDIGTGIGNAKNGISGFIKGNAPFTSVAVLGTAAIGTEVWLHNLGLAGIFGALVTQTRPLSKLRTSISERMSMNLKTRIQDAIGLAKEGKGAEAQQLLVDTVLNRPGRLGLSPNAATDGVALKQSLQDIADAKRHVEIATKSVTDAKNALASLKPGADPNRVQQAQALLTRAEGTLGRAEADFERAVRTAGDFKFKTNFATTKMGGFMRRLSYTLNAASAASALLTGITSWTGWVKAVASAYSSIAQTRYMRIMYRYGNELKSHLANSAIPHPKFSMITKAGSVNNFGTFVSAAADTSLSVGYMASGHVLEGLASLSLAAGEAGLYVASEKLKLRGFGVDLRERALPGVPVYIGLMGAGALGLLGTSLYAAATSSSASGGSPGPGQPTPGSK